MIHNLRGVGHLPDLWMLLVVRESKDPEQSVWSWFVSHIGVSWTWIGVDSPSYAQAKALAQQLWPSATFGWR